MAPVPPESAPEAPRVPLDGAPDRGVLVLAYGHSRYRRQAHSLGLSLQRHSPNMHRTLVTDNVRCAAAQAFHAVVPVNSVQSNDCRLKLSLDTFAPYANTLYLDADALAVRPIESIFDLFDTSDVGVVGRDIPSSQEEPWYGDVSAMCRVTGTEWLPKCNSGLVLLRATEVTRRAFARARELVDQYSDLGLHAFRGGVADEPLLAMTLAEQGIHAQDLTAIASATPIGINGPLRVNALSGSCTFTKQGIAVRPALIHFAADYSSDYRLAGSHYRRERLALHLSQRLGLSDRVARTAAALRYGLQCATFNTWTRLAGRAPRDPSCIFRAAQPPEVSQ